MHISDRLTSAARCGSIWRASISIYRLDKSSMLAIRLMWNAARNIEGGVDVLAVFPSVYPVGCW